MYRISDVYQTFKQKGQLSVIISEKYKFIYIAVPKTASRSIEKMLSPYGRSDFSVPPGEDKVHIKAYRLKELLPKGDWDSYFKFAFVRNPVGWTASWYFFRQKEKLKNPEHPKHENYTGNMSFDDFIRSNDWIFGWRQCDWVSDNRGEIIIDFIGKYENLYADLRKVCNKIGLPKQRLPWINRSKKAEHKHIYTKESMAIIAERFKEDIKKFGYLIDQRPTKPKGYWLQEFRNALSSAHSKVRVKWSSQNGH